MGHIVEFRDHDHLLHKLNEMKQDICDLIEIVENANDGEYYERGEYRGDFRGNYRDPEHMNMRSRYGYGRR